VKAPDVHVQAAKPSDKGTKFGFMWLWMAVGHAAVYGCVQWAWVALGEPQPTAAGPLLAALDRICGHLPVGDWRHRQ
jgi:hypothetical protein